MRSNVWRGKPHFRLLFQLLIYRATRPKWLLTRGSLMMYLKICGGGENYMEILFAISIATALLWLAFGDKKDWTGM